MGVSDMARKYVYLGKRVRDVPPKGLSSVREVQGIANSIVADTRSKRISRRKANARLLTLWFAVKRVFRGSARRKALSAINKARRALKLKPIKPKGGRRSRRRR